MTIDAFAEALRDELEQELVDDPAVTDLADVFARARAIDADAIPAGLVAVELDDVRDVVERRDPGLEAFAAALRDEAETSAGERQLVPIAKRSRWTGRVAAGLALAAAAVLAFVGLSQFGPQTAERDDADGWIVESHARESADAKQPFVPASPREHEPHEQPIAVEPAPDVPPVVVEPVVPAREPSKRHGPTIDELEEQARQRWAEGDLEGAEKLFGKIAARAGRTARAELAYGDLFALARQRGGAAAQAKAWRAYLRRFPSGRYADDARGGLCRLAPEAERDACWREYLAKHPSGAHAREARRRIGADPP